MEEFFKWFGIVGTFIGLIIGTIGMYFSWKAFNESRQTKRLIEKEKERLAEKVSIILSDGKKEHSLPSLRRQDVTRGEIQGRLGAIPMKQTSSRYEIEYTNSDDFHQRINLVSEGSNESGNSTLIINCTNEELAQFVLDPPKVKIKEPDKKVKQLKNGK